MAVGLVGLTEAAAVVRSAAHGVARGAEAVVVASLVGTE